MGYSIKTDRFHYVEWSHWDNDRKVKGDLVAVELYDNLSDPDENVNIAADLAFSKVVDELAEQLAQGWREALPISE